MPNGGGPKQLEIDFTEKPDLETGKAALERMLLKAYRVDLESDNPRRRRKGIKGLASLPRFAAAAVPALEKALKDQDYKVRQAAAAVLETIRSYDGPSLG